MEIPEIVGRYENDIFFYHGPISHGGYHLLISALENRKEKSDNVCLILNTLGGDPDCAFRLARLLNHSYDQIHILVPDVCKSAGTLLCIGAHKLFIGDRGELGPLDIQKSKPDELFESMSSLDIFQALNELENRVFKAFSEYLVNLRGNRSLKTTLAADIAAKLTEGFISPITAQIDPATLGEQSRKMQIAIEYGTRLSSRAKSLKVTALKKLVGGYPSHSFVIDRDEARELFENVENPEDDIQVICQWAWNIIPVMEQERQMSKENTIVRDIKDEYQKWKANNPTTNE